MNSSMLSFQMSASGEGGEIFLETREVVSEIVDEKTIKHRFTPDTYGIFNVDCRREKKVTGDSPPASGIDTVVRGNDTYAKLGFCPQRIFVGCKFSSSPSLPSHDCLDIRCGVFMLVSQVFMLSELNISMGRLHESLKTVERHFQLGPSMK